jgi:endo-1,4-beta-xylanase
MKSLLFTFFIFIFLPVLTIGNPVSKNEKDIFKKAKSNIEKYRKGNFSLVLKGNIKNVEVEVQQISHEFLFGCIIFDLVNHGRAPQDENLFKERFKQLFNFAVFPFYWAGYETKEGETKEKIIKEVVAWCAANRITAKGHPLAWTHTAGTPGWLADYSVEETKQLQLNRIHDIVDAFKNHIKIWDVLNEAIHTVNWEVAIKENSAGQDNRYVGQNFMSDKTGFIDSCFQQAHKANPDAQLILNEFDIVYNENSRQRFYDLLKTLTEIDTPVTGIGIQAHEPCKGRVYYSPEQIWATFETYSDFNLPLHITELIPVSNGDSIMGGYTTGIWTEQAQAEFAEMIFTLSFGYPLVQSVNWWGFSDRNIWQPKGGLVDENLNPKPVYETLDRLINRDWKTSFTGLKPNSEGEVSFRGFKGDYLIKVKKGNEIIKEERLSYTGKMKPLIINMN